jgi:DNA-binding MarR family transcriptional regulator
MSASPKSSPRRLMSRVGYLLNRTAFQIRGMAEAALKPQGLIPPHMAVLSTLHTEGPQTQRAMGEILRIDPTTMVWLIDDLEKKRLVRRGVHPKDRRAHLVELSADGLQAFRKASERLDRMEEEFLTPLAHPEREMLKQILTKLFKSVSTQEIPPKLFKGGHE